MDIGIIKFKIPLKFQAKLIRNGQNKVRKNALLINSASTYPIRCDKTETGYKNVKKEKGLSLSTMNSAKLDNQFSKDENQILKLNKSLSLRLPEMSI